MEQRSPRNTTADMRENPLGFIAAALGTGDVSQAIEEQERAGQSELLNSTTLPTEGPTEELEALGFTFGATVPGDDMFREATLPAGWSREGSDHAMWSYICDERAIRRVAIFYKAAFYDRSAFMRVCHVGSDVASKIIYADGRPGGPVRIPSALTDAELADVRASAESYLADAACNPDIYGDRAPNAQAVIDALDDVRTALRPGDSVAPRVSDDSRFGRGGDDRA